MSGPGTSTAAKLVQMELSTAEALLVRRLRLLPKAQHLVILDIDREGVRGFVHLSSGKHEYLKALAPNTD